jgi:endoglucanase
VIRSQLTKITLFAALAVLALANAAALTSASGSTVATIPRDPLSSEPFYIQKGTDAVLAAGTYRAKGATSDAALMERIAAEPQALWLTTSESVTWLKRTLAGARREHRLLTFVLYFIPGRDCGSYSSGGAKTASGYRAWVRRIAAQLGSTPTAAIVEPDALAELSCWDRTEQSTVYSLIRYAAKTLSAKPQTTVYLDAGNAAWQPVHTMVARLRRAGVSMVRGFSLNVSSFVNTSKSISYGTRIAKALGGKHFVVDTSRNGRGAYRYHGVLQWCNPPGRGLGLDPSADTASPLVDAYLWVKTPGESDGTCNGGPASGEWWPQYALGLAKRAEQP